MAGGRAGEREREGGEREREGERGSAELNPKLETQVSRERGEREGGRERKL